MFPTNPVDGQEWQNPVTLQWFRYVAANNHWIEIIGPTLPPTHQGGLPSGGTAGQHLAKKTNTDFDTEWVNADAAVHVHTQATPSAQWDITHGFGFAYVDATVVNTIGTQVIPDVRYITNDMARLVFTT